MISKTHKVAQKPHGRQLNAKACGSESPLFFLCTDHLSNNDNSKTAQVLSVGDRKYIPPVVLRSKFNTILLISPRFG